MTRKTYVWYIPDISLTYSRMTRKRYVWNIPDIFQTYDQMTRKRYTRHISRYTWYMTRCVIYQVYLEICLGYYTSGNIPGIYQGYLTSTDSRCMCRYSRKLHKKCLSMKCRYLQVSASIMSVSACICWYHISISMYLPVSCPTQ